MTVKKEVLRKRGTPRPSVICRLSAGISRSIGLSRVERSAGAEDNHQHSGSIHAVGHIGTCWMVHSRAGGELPNMASDPKNCAICDLPPPVVKMQNSGEFRGLLIECPRCGRKMQTRCHSVFEDHSSCAFFQDRCVATERTVNFAPLLRA